MSESSSGGGVAAPQSSPAPVADSKAASSPAESSNPQASAATSQGAPSEGAEAAVQEALDAGDTAEAQRLIKKFKLKIQGKEVEREVNLGDDDYLRNQFQLAEMSKRSMQESAELKKAYQAEIDRMRKDPWSVLSELGLDPDSLAEARIQERIEEMRKSPEQLEKERYQKELQEAREESKRLKDEKAQLEMSKLQEQASTQIQSEINEALSAHRSLPNSKYVVRKIADSMLWAMNNGFPDVSAQDVIPLVEQEMRKEFDQFYDEMPDEMLEKFIGQKTSERMRKRRLSKTKANPNVGQVKATTASVNTQPQEKAKDKLPAKDYFRQLAKGK
jgi:hypothetical protein